MNTSNALREEYYYPQEFSKSNVLINARYSASLLENQLLALGLQRVKRNDEAELVSYIPVTQIKKLLNKTSGNFYSTLKTTAIKLMNCIIVAETGDGKSFEAAQLVTYCKSSNGDLTMNFNPKLKDYVLNLSSNFTVLNIEEMAKLESVQSYRLYEILKSKSFYPKTFKGVKDGRHHVVFTIDELRVMLNGVDLNHAEITALLNGKTEPDYTKINEKAKELYKRGAENTSGGKYKAPKWQKWNHLREQVIDPAVTEITEKTDLEVSYDLIKSGKGAKVQAIAFSVFDRKYNICDINDTKNLVVIDLDDLADELRELIEEKISTKEIKQLLTVAGNDIEKVKKAYSVVSDMEYNNFMASMTAAIKEDWSPAVKAEKKNSFSFESEREYDIDELEAIMNGK